MRGEAELINILRQAALTLTDEIFVYHAIYTFVLEYIFLRLHSLGITAAVLVWWHGISCFIAMRSVPYELQICHPNL
jgi:hypothetical protein